MIRAPNMVTGIWRRFGVHAFEGHLTLDDMGKLEAFGNVWHKKNPGKVVEMAIVFPSDDRMEGEERARLVKVIRRWEMTRVASATVILAQGLLGAMHRSVLTGLMLVAPPPHPTKVFGATADAVAWLTPHVQAVCGLDASSHDLTAAVDALCATLRAPPASSRRMPAAPRHRGV
ncbi:MAG TPA: hypothetical protein VHV30_10420 [Polyangiaceae bacterium]|nr:hypothetical protein [Polyangiaceae bacterium]